MRTTIIFLTVLFSFTLSAQEWTDIETSSIKEQLRLLAVSMNKPEIQFSFTKSVYRNFSDETPESTSTGMVAIGKKLKYRSDADGILTIQNDAINMSVDQNTKQIYIMRCDSLMNNAGLNGFLNNSLSNYTAKMRTEAGLTYYLIFPRNPASEQTIELTVTAENELKELTIFMPEGNYYRESMDDESTETPKVTVSYTKPAKIDSDKSGLFSVSEWVIPSGKSYVLSEKASTNYSLHDLRYEKNH